MSSIGDILSKKDYQEPPEIGAIKDFVMQRFQSKVGVTVNDKQIIISANSAALAGTLRLHSYELSKVCQTDKKLTFKIASERTR